jgi:hypothetical protein
MTSVATADQVSGRTELAPRDASAVLAELAERGFVTEQTGRLAGWSLTASGRAEGERLLVAELDAAGERPAVDAAYRRFLEVNPTFLQLCTQWQLVELDGVSTLNDHQDPARDAAVLDRLAEVHDVVLRIGDDLTTALDRFRGYRPRFEFAMSRLAANDVDWFTKPLIDSYHSVWFELHEDLLATLGRDRTSEHPAGARTEGQS